MKAKMLRIALAAFFMAVCLNLHLAMAADFADRSAEINQHIETLSSGALVHKIEAAKIITRSGFTDPKLFNLIESELLDNYQTASGSAQIDYVSWLCKALASSGMIEYKSTLQKVSDNTDSKKIKRYADQSLALFDEYANRAKIISNSQNVKEGRDPEVARLMNMLQSAMLDVKRDAAKLISRNKYKDADLFKVVNYELLNGYNRSDEKKHVDTMAWLCKALATSNDPVYKDTLQTIIESSGNAKLVKYAIKALEMMD